MSDMDLMAVPPAPPILDGDGKPVPCPRCGGIFERPLPGIPGHPVGHPRLCLPLSTGPRDARDRKASSRGRR